MIIREVVTGQLNMGVNKTGGGSLLIWCAVLSNLSYMWKPQYAPIARAALLRYFCAHFQLANGSERSVVL